MPPWVLDSALSHATKRQLAFMYDIGVLAPFMLDVACVQQLEKLDEGEAAYALDELGKALSDRVRLRNPSGFFIRICQRLRATRRERDAVVAAAAPPAAASGEGGPPPAGGPVSFAEREQARERERERERARLGDGGGLRQGGADGGGGGFGGTPGGGSLGPPAGSSPRVGGGFGGPPGMGRGPGRGVRGGPNDPEGQMGDGPPGGGFRHRGRSSSRSPPPRRGGPDRPGFWGPGGEGLVPGFRGGRHHGGKGMQCSVVLQGLLCAGCQQQHYCNTECCCFHNMTGSKVCPGSSCLVRFVCCGTDSISDV
jgi:hypothetical protein